MLRDKMFEPLFSTKSFGVGLGVPITGQIIQQHGGTMEIDGVIGQGATVTLRLPLERSALSSEIILEEDNIGI